MASPRTWWPCSPGSRARGVDPAFVGCARRLPGARRAGSVAERDGGPRGPCVWDDQEFSTRMPRRGADGAGRWSAPEVAALPSGIRGGRAGATLLPCRWRLEDRMSHLVESLVASLLLLAPPSALAQNAPPQGRPEPEPEVLLGGTGHNGGWGAPVVHVTTVRDRAAVFLGGRGGWLLDGRVTIGGGGFGLVTPVPAPPEAGKAGEDLDLAMAYGGAWMSTRSRRCGCSTSPSGHSSAEGNLAELARWRVLRVRERRLLRDGAGARRGAQPRKEHARERRRRVPVDRGRTDAGPVVLHVAGFSLVVAMKFGRF